MIRFFILFYVLFYSIVIFSQNEKNTLNIEEVLAIVKEYHPVLQQAKINIEKSDAEISIAKGAFNPLISNIISSKIFNNTNYYEYINPNITIPTWFGIELSGGIENLTGNRIDPSETIGASHYMGISIPLLKNLVIDKRRAFLNQSKLFKEMAYIEQLSIVNNTLMDAAEQYWSWLYAYESFQIIDKNFTVSKQRFEMVKKAFQNGERPAIDTIEALSQLQNFEFQKNESWVLFQNEGLKLSAFLWKANNIPYQLPETIIPQKGWDNENLIRNFDLNLSTLLSSAIEFHPELQMYKQKINILSIDKKLKFQELLPKLDFKYNHLGKGLNDINTDGLLFRNNYQYGIKFEMPIPFSQGRGEFKKAKLKIDETLLVKSQKTLFIELKIKNYYNEFINIKKQIQLQRNILNNFEKLLKAETNLFQNGESSLFLINSRENKVLDVERKLTELKAKYYKTIYSLQWSAGLLK